MREATVDRANTNRFVGNIYSKLLSYLSLYWPALWRLRVDILVINSMIMLMLAVAPFSVRMLFDSDIPDIDIAIWSVFGPLSICCTVGMGLLWVLLILRNERLRFEPRFRNSPLFSTIFICVSSFFFFQALFALVRALAQAEVAEASQLVAYTWVMPSLIICGWVALTIGIIAIILKIILLSSVIRMLGSLALALGIAASVLSVLAAILILPAKFCELYLPQVHKKMFAPSFYPLSLLYCTCIVLAISIFFLSRVIFRGITLKRCIWAAPFWVGCAILGELAIVCVLYQMMAIFPNVIFFVDSFHFWSAVTLLVGFFMSFFVPHVVAIGGDLVNGSRSRLTSPVILSCFWSVPACILGGAEIALDLTKSYSIAGVPVGELHPLMTGISALVCVAAVECLSWLAVRIAYLPQP